MTRNLRRSYHIARRAGHQGARPGLRGQDSDGDKYATDPPTVPTVPTTPLFKGKKTTRLSTFNVRTLSGESQIPELIASAIEYGIDVICIQEHRISHDDLLVKYHNVGSGWSLITTSSWKNATNSSIGGVGLLLSPTASSSLINIEKITPRIVVANFDGNPAVSIVSCYSPTNVSEELEVSVFYDELSSLVRSIPKHNVLLIAGDLNAQLGPSHANRYALHTKSNRNGEYLEHFLIQNSLCCLNMQFQKREGKKWSHTYPNGSKALLDYIIINKKWKNSARNCECYNTFEGVYSDHRIVTSNIQLSLRSNKQKKSNRPCYDWKQLSQNKVLQNQFCISLSNRFDGLTDESDDTNIVYEAFISAHQQAAADVIPVKHKHKQRVPWENDVVKSKRESLKKISKLKNRHPTKSNVQRYKNARKELEQAYIREQQIYIQKQIDDIQQAADNQQSSKAWQIINEISGRKQATNSKLKASNQEDRVHKWRQHFEGLLGSSPDVNDAPIRRTINYELPIKKGPFSIDELQKALKSTKNGKAAGLDGIPPEVWKTGNFNEFLLNCCNEVYHLKPIEAWRKGCILPFPKKGDLSNPGNYRGITLTCIAAKIYNTMIRNRLLPEIEKILRPNQNGFRQNQSTTGQILTVRRILEGVRAKNLKASIIFVDFSKAFDSVHRGKLSDILLSYGIPAETVAAIMMLYSNTEAMVRSPDGDTDFFKIQAGVLQGDTLAPLLFIIALDYVLRNSLDIDKDLGFTLKKTRSRRYPAVKITDADYADDLALFADEIQSAEKLLHSLENAASTIGLHVNAKKTEIMNLNQTGTVKTIADKPLKEAERFIYLGSEISSTANDIKIRIGKAWDAVDKMSSIWKSSLSDDLKRRFFRAVVEPVLLYGSTTWTLLKSHIKSLDGTYTRMLRAILNKSWKEHPTKCKLYASIPPITDTIKERRMRFAGHCYRSKDELISSLLFWTPAHGYTSVGRPYKTYIDVLSEDAGLNPAELKIAMQDRDDWRRRVNLTRAIRPIR